MNTPTPPRYATVFRNAAGTNLNLILFIKFTVSLAKLECTIPQFCLLYCRGVKRGLSYLGKNISRGYSKIEADGGIWVQEEGSNREMGKNM